MENGCMEKLPKVKRFNEQMSTSTRPSSKLLQIMKEEQVANGQQTVKRKEQSRKSCSRASISIAEREDEPEENQEKYSLKSVASSRFSSKSLAIIKKLEEELEQERQARRRLEAELESVRAQSE